MCDRATVETALRNLPKELSGWHRMQNVASTSVEVSTIIAEHVQRISNEIRLVELALGKDACHN